MIKNYQKNFFNKVNKFKYKFLDNNKGYVHYFHLYNFKC